MSDTVKSWIEERWEFVQGSKLRRWGDKDIRRLTDAIEAVLELHKPFEWSFGFETIRSCLACAEMGAEQDCANWLCATVQAIEGAINGERG
ncbi:hypothetical protein [Brevibacterium sp. CT2-23B]|uniref:hypothetical protein n=1 Tax=Brevibacterium sp. CT2-23B TaxID=2729630 RepID=UPI00155197F5|nr:hypothetical protein [Brevibacterium sp. CT2-23B]